MLPAAALLTFFLDPALLPQLLQMRHNRPLRQTMHRGLDIRVDFLHDCARLPISALPGCKYFRLPLHSMIEILLNFCLCVRHHRTVSWEQCGNGQRLHSFQRIEIRRHVSFQRINHNGSQTRHQITRDEGSVLLLEYADMPPRVSGCMQYAKIPSGLTSKLEPFAVGESAVDLHHTFKIVCL